ncbi:MAG: serine/threonine-protein phosphatase [Rhodopirellula sp.]|nr:serine/threonine-protein phosphatase [Rhodopirellula sp.]
MLAVKYAAVSDPGRVRQSNEDNWAVDTNGGLFVVADGMGGRPAGALAAKIAVQALPGLVQTRLAGAEGPLDQSSCQVVAEAFCTLNREMVEQTRGKFGLESMGTTVVLALIRGRSALVAHLGDSRAYLLHSDELRQLTRDHSIVQILLDHGEITADEVADHPGRGQITMFIGMESDPLPDVCIVDLHDADRLLLCTDGLTNLLPEPAIGDVLAREHRAGEACRQLVDAANAAGGADNVTVMIIDLTEKADVSLRPSQLILEECCP